MRTLLCPRQAFQWRTVHLRLEAAVHLCCHQLLPNINAVASRKGRIGNVAVDVTASTLAACRRTTQK